MSGHGFPKADLQGRIRRELRQDAAGACITGISMPDWNMCGICAPPCPVREAPSPAPDAARSGDP